MQTCHELTLEATIPTPQKRPLPSHPKRLNGLRRLG